MSGFLTTLGESAFDAWLHREPQCEQELDTLCTTLMQAEAALMESGHALPSEAFGEAIGQCEIGSLALLLGVPTLCADAGRRVLELATFSLELEVQPIRAMGQTVDEAAWRAGVPLSGFKAALKSFFDRHQIADEKPNGFDDVLKTFGECCKFVHCNPTIWDHARNGICFSATNVQTGAAKELLASCVRHSVYMVLATHNEIIIDDAQKLFGPDWAQIQQRLGVA